MCFGVYKVRIASADCAIDRANDIRHFILLLYDRCNRIKKYIHTR